MYKKHEKKQFEQGIQLELLPAISNHARKTVIAKFQLGLFKRHRIYSCISWQILHQIPHENCGGDLYMRERLIHA